MRNIMIVTSLAGFILTAVIVLQLGVVEVSDAIFSVGWEFLAVLLVHPVQIVQAAIGWKGLFVKPSSLSLVTVIEARWIRESANCLLPVAQIGGELFGARVLSIRGLRGGDATASVVVDLTVEIFAQFLFVLLGLALVLNQEDNTGVIEWIIIGTMIAAPVLLAFLAAQRYGLFLGVERFLLWLTTRWSLLYVSAVEGLHDGIQRFYRNPRGLLLACSMHLLAWLTGTFEVWLILYFIGDPVTLRQALVLESLGHAIRSAAFVVPGGIGVQEGAYVLLAMTYGIPPQQGLALSLIKRAREIILGLPGLVIWSALESRKQKSTNGQYALPGDGD